MIKAVKVESRPGYRIWVEFSDGVAGEIDLSDVAGRGVFAAWNEPGFFEKVHVDSYGAVAWSEDIDLCPYSLYMDLTGKPVEEVMPGVRFISQDA